MDWASLTDDQKFTATVAMLSAGGGAAIGGVFSLVASIVVFWISSNRERNRRIADEKEQLRNFATTGLIKLTMIASGLYSLHRYFSCIFETAEKEGLDLSQPSRFILPMAGASDKLLSIEPQELRFLFEAGKAELVSEILILEQRYNSAVAAMERYGQEKSAFQNWLDENSEIHEQKQSRATFSLKPEDAKFAELKRTSLDGLITTIYQHVETDFTSSRKLTSEYQSIAADFFRERGFPGIELDLSERSN